MEAFVFMETQQKILDCCKCVTTQGIGVQYVIISGAALNRLWHAGS